MIGVLKSLSSVSAFWSLSGTVSVDLVVSMFLHMPCDFWCGEGLDNYTSEFNNMVILEISSSSSPGFAAFCF